MVCCVTSLKVSVFNQKHFKNLCLGDETGTYAHVGMHIHWPFQIHRCRFFFWLWVCVLANCGESTAYNSLKTTMEPRKRSIAFVCRLSITWLNKVQSIVERKHHQMPFVPYCIYAWSLGWKLLVYLDPKGRKPITHIHIQLKTLKFQSGAIHPHSHTHTQSHTYVAW